MQPRGAVRVRPAHRLGGLTRSSRRSSETILDPSSAMANIPADHVISVGDRPCRRHDRILHRKRRSSQHDRLLSHVGVGGFLKGMTETLQMLDASPAAVPVAVAELAARDRHLLDLRPGLHGVRGLRSHRAGRRHAASLRRAQSGLRRHLRRHGAGSFATRPVGSPHRPRSARRRVSGRAPRVPRSAIDTPSTIATARSAPRCVVTACGLARPCSRARQSRLLGCRRRPSRARAPESTTS